jgi:hypothetical protein
VMAGIPRRYRRQAADLSTVRYGPEVSALTALIRQAEEDRDQRVRTARSTASLIQGAVDEARPGVRAVYRDAGRQSSAQQQIAASALTPGSPFAQAAAIEQSGLRSRMSGARAAALTDLTSRRIAAGEGAAYAQSAAQRDFAKTRGQIGQRAQDLAREQGAFQSSTIMDLIGADQKARADAVELSARLGQQERNSIRSSGIDPNTGKPIPGGRLDPKARPGKGNAGRGWATSTQQAAAQDTIGQAIHEAKTLKQSGAKRHEVAQMLLEGVDDVPRKEIPVYDPATGKKKLNRDGTPVTKAVPAVPGVKAIPHKLFVQAAIDIAYDGHLSKRTTRLLHARGIKIKPLGIRTYSDFLRAIDRISRRPIRTPPLAPDGSGQMRPT